MAKKTLFHVIHSLTRGGAEMLLTNTLKLLPEYSHVLVTLAPDADLLPEIAPLLSASYCLHVKGVTQWPAAVVRLHRLIQKHKPLLVHTHMQISSLLAKVACPARVPLFYTIHNTYSEDAFAHNRLALPLERLTARRRHHLIGVSGWVLDDYQRLVPHSGTRDVVYNMVGKEFFGNGAPPAYVPGMPLKLVSVGTLNLPKNYPYTLRALALVKHLPITLDIYGGGDATELQALAQRYGLNNVRFIGSSPAIAQVLPNYHVYLISSSSEGFGIAPLEAMAMGLPVLASDIPVFREVVGDKVLSFNITDDASLANLLSDIFEGKTALQPLGEPGRKHAHDLSFPDSYKKTLVRTYEKYVAI